jgi:signal transduction histidine kinase/DNA-binding response OmpR family regulator/CHASE3 domain sensor protein
MKSTLKRNLQIGFGASLLLLIVSSAASWYSIRNLLSSSSLVAHTNQVREKLEQALSSMKDAETGQRGYLITNKEEFLDPYRGSLARTISLLNEIEALTSDNLVQRQNTETLKQYVQRRFGKLQDVIEYKKQTGIVNLADMETGKLFMDSVRTLVARMQDQESLLLANRTEKQSRFAGITPAVITTAALLAILITILFYIRTNRDVDERMRLTEELERKDAAIRHRLQTIHRVSEKISAGDYSVRVNDEGSDELGSISGALNKMAKSLETSFADLSAREWLTNGMAGFSETMISDFSSLQELAEKAVSYIASYTNSSTGAVYLCGDDQNLQLIAGFALTKDAPTHFRKGEGIPGECAVSKKRVLITDIPDGQLHINYSSASLHPSSIIVFPVMFGRALKAVVELAALHTYSEKELEFLAAAANNAGTAINTFQNRQRVQELLEETQSQAEELMAQQTELEQINAELEAQTQQLQTSEEELKVQSEELIEINSLLEEKSGALEQRNQIVLQKNAEIEQKAEDLARATKYKSEFLANMSHELRTPLNSILLLSRLLAENNEKNLSPEQVQYAEVIQGSGNGLLQLIDEILDLSKIEAGKMTVEWLPVKVHEIAKDMELLFSIQAKEKQLDWQLRIDPGVPAQLQTDKQRLEQVLSNLLSNALKFTSKGFIRLHIYPSPDNPGYVCFSVRDTGIGISHDQQEQVFEAFRQEDGSTRRRFGGTGLGLSISRQLAVLLGGNITLSSTAGEGSEFICTIPVEKPEEKVIRTREEAAVTGFAAESEKENQLLSTVIPNEVADDRSVAVPGDKTILIVEDDVQFAAALVDFARQKGYKALVAVRGDRGIEMAAEYQPSGILLDIQLPVMNGWQVMEALRKNTRTRHIPVHIMSSFSAKNESLLQGAVDFISKPVAFEQLHTLFDKLELILSKQPKKVLIIEENNKHAKALAYYLATYQVRTRIHSSVDDSVQSLYDDHTDCVILDNSSNIAEPDNLLASIRGHEGLEELPIIVFTGKSLSRPEEFRLKKYADSIVLKTANSYRRILDEVSLFLHLMQEQQKKQAPDFEKSVLQENVLKGKKILLADDDVRNIFSMTRVLEKFQMTVIPAMDGKEALQLVQSQQPDVVLMDIMMPEMDGFESIRNIRAIPAFKTLPIIAITAKAMSGDREKCIQAGASDYISKPVDTDQLVSLLRIWLYEKGY